MSNPKHVVFSFHQWNRGFHQFRKKKKTNQVLLLFWVHEKRKLFGLSFLWLRFAAFSLKRLHHILQPTIGPTLGPFLRTAAHFQLLWKLRGCVSLAVSIPCIFAPLEKAEPPPCDEFYRVTSKPLVLSCSELSSTGVKSKFKAFLVEVKISRNNH